MPKSGKILLMDDELIILEVSKKMLEVMKYDVSCVQSGDQAIDLYKKNMHENDPFDLVILDLTVPGGIGAEVAIQELIEIDPNVRAIISSGKPNENIVMNYKDYGFAGAIIKPFSFDEFNTILTQVLPEKHN